MISCLLGLVSLIKPARFLGIRTRRRAGVCLAAGLLLVAAGWVFPIRETRITLAHTRLDQFAPVYQFGEFHETHTAAPCDRAYRAIRDVTAGEIRLFRTLIWIRRFGRSGPESILNAPERQPLLDVATRTSFIWLADEPAREIVVGTAVVVPPGYRPTHRPTPDDYKALHQPGFALAAMNFLLEDASPGCRVSTETRVSTTDATTARRFALYWRVIYPGSALIRRMWLRAIRRRAEGIAGLGSGLYNTL